MPNDAKSGGSSFTEKVTALWPPRRQRTRLPTIERKTVKAHVLAHVARSRRSPGRPAARPEFALPWQRKQPLELPLPPSRAPRGSQTTPRLDDEPALAAVESPALAALAAPDSSGPHAAPSASAADAWADDPAAPADTEMPPLYAGISPYRHALPASLFELTAVSKQPAALASAVAPAAMPALERRPSAPARSRRRAAQPRPRRRRSLASRPLPVAILLVAAFLWAVAYWQTWSALSMTERCRAVWETVSGLLEGG